MEVRTEKRFVVSLTATEAGMLASLLGMVGGPIETPGRVMTEALRVSLIGAGAVPVDAFDSDGGIDAADIAL